MEISRRELPKVALSFKTDDSMSLRTKIMEQRLDLAIVFEDEPSGPFLRKPLFRQRLFLIRCKRTARSPSSITLERLADQPLILPTHPNLVRTMLDRAFASANIIPTIAVETDVYSGMLSAVQSGMGDAILPKGDFSDVPEHSGVLSLLIEPPLYLTASVICSNETPLTRAAEAVRDLFCSFAMRHLQVKSPPGAEWIDS